MAQPAPLLIHAQNLTKSYAMGDQIVHALRGVSVDIHAGDFVAIMGASGSGKSTLMNILGCLDLPTQGLYELAGEAVQGMQPDQLASIRNRRIGFVFQQFNLLPRTSALENVELPMVYAGVPSAARRERAMAALQLVGLGERHKHTPSELSGGQQQRVAIARALVNQPQLILADEPTGALDSQTSEDIMRLLVDLNHKGMTVVLVTHESDIAAWARRPARASPRRTLWPLRSMYPRCRWPRPRCAPGCRWCLAMPTGAPAPWAPPTTTWKPASGRSNPAASSRPQRWRAPPRW
jgi:putative ABC transport system ATP-binding protein